MLKKIKHLSAVTLVVSLIMMATSFSNAQSGDIQQAQFDVANGTIDIIATPDDFAFENVFLPETGQAAQTIYKTLTPGVSGNVMKVADLDGTGLNFKITMIMSNFTSGAAVIPFTDFSAVTLATNTIDGVDADPGSLAAASGDVTARASCVWDGSDSEGPQNTTNPLEVNCGSALDANRFSGQATLEATVPTDPTLDLNNSAAIIEVGDSGMYTGGEVILMGSAAPPNDLEYALIKEILSPNEIRVIRGISGTSAYSHIAGSGITRLGTESTDKTIMVAPDPGNRLGVYSMGFGLRGTVDPRLELVPGSYAGTITFTRYICPTLECI